jgi:hypothetical protein
MDIQTTDLAAAIAFRSDAVRKRERTSARITAYAITRPNGISPGASRPHLRRLNAMEVGLATTCLVATSAPAPAGGPRVFMARGVGCRGALTQPERGCPAGPVARAVIAPGMASMRKHRSFKSGWRTPQIGPFADLRGRPHERAVSARKRTLAEEVGCASSDVRAFAALQQGPRLPAAKSPPRIAASRRATPHHGAPETS